MISYIICFTIGAIYGMALLTYVLNKLPDDESTI